MADNTTSREGLQTIQDEMLDLAHQITRERACLHRLRAQIQAPEDLEQILDGSAPRTLAFDLHGDLETAAEALGAAARSLRRGGLKTDDLLLQEFLFEKAQELAEPDDEPSDPSKIPDPDPGTSIQ